MVLATQCPVSTCPQTIARVNILSIKKQGNLRTELHFGQALANTVNLVIYAEF